MAYDEIDELRRKQKEEEKALTSKRKFFTKFWKSKPEEDKEVEATKESLEIAEQEFKTLESRMGDYNKQVEESTKDDVQVEDTLQTEINRLNKEREEALADHKKTYDAALKEAKDDYDAVVKEAKQTFKETKADLDQELVDNLEDARPSEKEGFNEEYQEALQEANDVLQEELDTAKEEYESEIEAAKENYDDEVESENEYYDNKIDEEKDSYEDEDDEFSKVRADFSKHNLERYDDSPDVDAIVSVAKGAVGLGVGVFAIIIMFKIVTSVVNSLSESMVVGSSNSNATSNFVSVGDFMSPITLLMLFPLLIIILGMLTRVMRYDGGFR